MTRRLGQKRWGDLKRTSQSWVVLGLGPSLVLDAGLACCASVTFGVIGRRWTAIRARLLRPIALLGTLESCA